MDTKPKVVPGIDESQILDLLSELGLLNEYETEQEGDLTIKAVMDATKRSRNAARNMLDRGVDEGKLEKLKGMSAGGKPYNIYRPIKKPSN